MCVCVCMGVCVYVYFFMLLVALFTESLIWSPSQVAFPFRQTRLSKALSEHILER